MPAHVESKEAVVVVAHLRDRATDEADDPARRPVLGADRARGLAGAGFVEEREALGGGACVSHVVPAEDLTAT